MTRTIVDDIREIHDGFNAINAAQAEHDAQMIDNEIRVKEIERIQEQIQHKGVSRSLVEELQEVAGQDDLLLQRGVAVESFTSFPSRTNQRVSIEVSDELKAGLIGAAAAAAAFIVYKLIKLIYNFFKKRSTASSSIKEKEAKVNNALKIIQELDKLKNEEEVKDVLDDAKLELIKKRLNEVEGKWTYLLDEVFGSSGGLRGQFIQYVGETAKELDERGPLITNIVSNLSFQLDKQDSAGLKNWIEEHVERKLLSLDRVKGIDKDVLSIQEFSTQVKEAAQKPSQMQADTMAKALKVAAESYQVWKDLESKTSLDNSKLNDENYVKKLEDDLKELQERLKKPIPNLGQEYVEYVKVKLNELKTVHTKTFKMYAEISASASLLAVQLDNFLETTLTAYKVQAGFFTKLFTKGEHAAKFATLKKLVDEGKNLDQLPEDK